VAGDHHRAAVLILALTTSLERPGADPAFAGGALLTRDQGLMGLVNLMNSLIVVFALGVVVDYSRFW
jgi:hypothetical protein